MAGKTEPLPGEYAKAVVDALRDVMDNDRIRVVKLAEMTGRSNNYMARRFRKECAFTLTDIEDICTALELDPADLLGNVVLPALEMSEVVDNVIRPDAWTAEQIERVEKRVANHDPEMDTDEPN